ncbi:MAG: hypothetical protein K2W82_02525 [Candidatus Obscuribacterales bacterium]|nr:hypothetical protein [Candidatus Obscuribacterales bacterium]
MWEGDGGGSGGSLQTKGQQVPQDTPQEIQAKPESQPAIENAAQEAWAPPGTKPGSNENVSDNPAVQSNPESVENAEANPENVEQAASLKAATEAAKEAKEDPSIADAARKVIADAVRNSGNPAVQAMMTGFDLVNQSANTTEKSAGQPEQSFSAGLDNRTLAAASNSLGHAWDSVSSAIGLTSPDVQKPQEAKPESAQAVAAGEWLKNATPEQRENYAAGVEKMDGAASDKWYAGASDLEKQAFFEHLTRSTGDGAADDARQDAWWTKVGAEQRQGYLDHPYKEQYDWSTTKPSTPADVVIAQPPATTPVSDVPVATPVQPISDAPVVQAPATKPAEAPATPTPVTTPAKPETPVATPTQPSSDAPVVQAPVTKPAVEVPATPTPVTTPAKPEAPVATPVQPGGDAPIVQAPVTKPAVEAPTTPTPVTAPAQPVSDAPIVQAPVTKPAVEAPTTPTPVTTPVQPDAPAKPAQPVVSPATTNPAIGGSREAAMRQAAEAHLGGQDLRKQEIARNQISSATAAEAYHVPTAKPDTVVGGGHNGNVVTKPAEAPVAPTPMPKTPANDGAGGLNRQPVADTTTAPNTQKVTGSDNLSSGGFSPKQQNAEVPPSGSARQPVVVDTSPTQNQRGSTGDNVGGAVDKQPKADAQSSTGSLNKQQNGDLPSSLGQSRGPNADTAIGGKPNVVEGQPGPGRQYRDGIGDGVQGGPVTKAPVQEMQAAGGPNKPAVDGVAVKGDLGTQPGTSVDRVSKVDGIRSGAEHANSDLAQGAVKGETKLARGINDGHGATALPGASEAGGAAHSRDGKAQVATSGEPVHIGKTNEVGVRVSEAQGRGAEVSGKPGEVNARVAESSGKLGEIAPRATEAGGKSIDGMPVVKNAEGVTRVDGTAGQNITGKIADGTTVVADGGANVRFSADSGTKTVVDANGRLVEGKLSGEKALAGSEGTTAKTVAVQPGANVVIATGGFEGKSGKVSADKIADGVSDSTSTKTTTSPVAGIGLSQLGQSNNQGTTQSTTSDPRQQANSGAAAGAGVQLQPVNLPGVQIVSNDPNQVNATGAVTVDPKTGAPIDPKTGAPVDPKAQATVDPKTGAPVDPKAQATVDPKTGAPVDPKAQIAVDPKTGTPIDPKTGLPVDPKTQGTRDPKSGVSQGGSSDLVLGVPGSPSIGFVVGSATTELAGSDMFAEREQDSSDSLSGSVSVSVPAVIQVPTIQPIVDVAVLGWQASQISTSAQPSMPNPNPQSVSTSVSGSVISHESEPTIVQLEPRREANQPIPSNVDRAFDGTEEDRAAGRTVTNPDGTISVGTIGTEPGNQPGAPIPGNGEQPGLPGSSVPTGGNGPVVDPIPGGIGGGVNPGATIPGGSPNLPSDPQPAPIVTNDPLPTPQHPATAPVPDPVAPVSGTPPHTQAPVSEPIAENKKVEGSNHNTIADSTHTEKQTDVVKVENELTRAAKIAAEMAVIEAAAQAMLVGQPSRPNLLENRPDGDRVETIDQLGLHGVDEHKQADVLTSLREIMAPLIDPLSTAKNGSVTSFVNPLAENEMLPVTVADNLQEIIVRVVSGRESGQTFIAQAQNAGLSESSIEQIVQIIDTVKLIDSDNSGLATEESVLANLFSQAGARTTYTDPASVLAEMININGLDEKDNVSEPVKSLIDPYSLAHAMENKQDEILEQLKLKDKEDERKSKEKQDQAEEEAEAKRNAAAMLVALKSKQAQEAAARLQAQKTLIEKQLAARQKYVVAAGDTLESIAFKKLNNKRLAPLLFELNKSKIPVKVKNGKRYLQLKAKTILLLPTVIEIQRYNARLFGQNADEFQYESGAPETVDATKVVKMDAVAAKRLANIEAVLGKMNETLPADGRIRYVCRLGDSLRSIAVRHPALNDVSLWALLAQVNGLSCAIDENGLPLEELKRGMALVFPSAEEIAIFRQNSDDEKAKTMKKGAHSFQECLKIS